jgi:3-oxoacyl-[acyl-carrier-protein] synthase-3
MPNAAVAGVGVSVPERALTNFDLEKMVETSDEWIRTRTGIRERRIVSDGVCTSDLAAEAARGALAEAGVAAEDVDLIILATFSPDCPYPATACATQAKIGAGNAAAFDLSAMCSGFVYGLSVAQQYIRTGAAETVLLIGAEVLSSVLDYRDRNTCVLFGDAAGAVLLKPCDKPCDGGGAGEVLVATMGTFGEGYEFLWAPAGGSRTPVTEDVVKRREQYLKMNGREIFKLAVHKFQDGIRDAAAAAGWGLDEIDLVVPHQVNKRIIKAVISRIGIPEDRFYQNLERYGNTSAASIPLALYEAVHEGRLKRGDKVILAAVGGGITWGSAAVRW